MQKMKLNEKVRYKMYKTGYIPKFMLDSNDVPRDIYMMYLKDVSLLDGIDKTVKAQKEAYEERIEDIKREGWVIEPSYKSELKKLEKIYNSREYKEFQKESKKKKPKTQKEAVIRHLEDEGFITSWDAFMEYGITRLSAIIYILRHNEGMDISSQAMTTKNRYGNIVNYAKYTLNKEEV